MWTPPSMSFFKTELKYGSKRARPTLYSCDRLKITHEVFGFELGTPCRNTRNSQKIPEQIPEMFEYFFSVRQIKSHKFWTTLVLNYKIKFTCIWNNFFRSSQWKIIDFSNKTTKNNCKTYFFAIPILLFILSGKKSRNLPLPIKKI